jgi:hypothetical protein
VSEVTFYTQVAPLMEELEAAREVRREEPVRWEEAKQAFAEVQTFYRLLDEAARAYMQGDDTQMKALEACGIPVEITEAQEEVHNYNVTARPASTNGGGTATAPGGN